MIRYGQTAGALTSDALKTIGNVYYAQHNFKVLKPKGFTKAAISGVGNAILKNYNNPKLKAKPHEEFQGSGPGSGSGFQSQ